MKLPSRAFTGRERTRTIAGIVAGGGVLPSVELNNLYARFPINFPTAKQVTTAVELKITIKHCIYPQMLIKKN